MSKTARMMKDSGIEWIGQIPATWETRKNKYLLDFMYSGGTPTATNDSFYTDKDGTPFVSIADLTKSYLVTETAKCVTEEGILNKKLRTLPPGTLLYSIYATIGAVAELGINATISQAILALGINVRKVNKDFYKYNLLGMHDYIVSEVNSNSQDNLNAQKVSNFIFPLPPLPEQKQIAAYLDKKCGKIDSIIAGEETAIEKLKAYKQSLITETVTKGLDPEAPMKDSGIEWIGEIPAGWTLLRLKYLVTYNDEVLDEDTDETFCFDYIDIGSVEYGKGITDKQRMLFQDAPLRARRVVRQNDVILSTVRTYLKAIATIEDSDMPQIASTGFVVLRARGSKLSFRFLNYAVLSKSFISMVEANSVGVSYPAINASDVVSFSIPTPPLPEQTRIAAYLDKKCAAIDSNIASRQSLIEKLTAYKKSLIYEVVTGKKEV